MGWIELLATIISAAAWPVAVAVVVWLLRQGLVAILLRIADQEVESIEIVGQKMTFAKAVGLVADKVSASRAASEHSAAEGEAEVVEGVGDTSSVVADAGEHSAKGADAAGQPRSWIPDDSEKHELNSDAKAAASARRRSIVHERDLERAAKKRSHDLARSRLAMEQSIDPSVQILYAWDHLMDRVAKVVRRSFPERGIGRSSYEARLSMLLQSGHFTLNEIEAVRSLNELRNAVIQGKAKPSAAEAYSYRKAADELGATLLERSKG